MSNQISLQSMSSHYINNFNNKADKLKKLQQSNQTSSVDKKDIKAACCEFESLFIYQLFKEMRATIPNSGFIQRGMAEEIYTSLLDSQVAKELASQRGIGLSSILYEQFDNK